ncbi:hypothetical protein Hanom_Chr07g00614831 [Helianthus anomalus]
MACANRSGKKKLNTKSGIARSAATTINNSTPLQSPSIHFIRCSRILTTNSTSTLSPAILFTLFLQSCTKLNSFRISVHNSLGLH